MEFPFAKKSLGQNFLTSVGALMDIVGAAEVRAGDEILEIGPGRGVLTKELLKAGARVTAVEKDRELVVILREMFKEEVEKGQLKIIEDDILTFDLVAHVASINRPYKLIANIPYYITGQIFRMFLEGNADVNSENKKEGEKNGVSGWAPSTQPTSITILVQKEVAERVIARDGKESILSFSVKAYGTPRYVAIVKRGSFNPPPNVDSAILHIGNISKKFFTDHAIDEKVFFEVLKAAFAHKRKMISKNLSDKGFALPPGETYKKARAEDLALEDFAVIVAGQKLV